MKQIQEPSKTIPVMSETDVLVVGSGPAGLAAALAAAREGVDTVLVERFGWFGGNITQSMVESIAWYRHEKTVDAGGIGVEFERRAQEMGATQPEPQSLSEALDADMFKVVADRIVQESGITPILHCFAVDAIMDGNTIKGVITESKSGRQAILAKRVIDATGDADIVHHAGAPYRKASKEELLGVTVTLLRTFGSSLGTRESRKIIGAYNITEHDVRNEARFEDAIGIFPEFLDAYGVVIIPTTGRYFQVPYGIILPQKVENLLVAGRCVAGDKISHAATRQMMCCTVTGQGAGVAAAVSLKQHVTCRQVDISQVQKSLQRQGVRIA